MATVWDPITIGNVEIKNRIAYPPMLSNLCSPDGYATRAMANYYAERARGGVGMVTIEVHFITRGSRVSRPLEGGVPLIDDDTHIEPLKQVSAAILDNGAAAFAQMAHMGKYGLSGGKKIVPSLEAPLGMLSKPWLKTSQRLLAALYQTPRTASLYTPVEPGGFQFCDAKTIASGLPLRLGRSISRRWPMMAPSVAVTTNFVAPLLGIRMLKEAPVGIAARSWLKTDHWLRSVSYHSPGTWSL